MCRCVGPCLRACLRVCVCVAGTSGEKGAFLVKNVFIAGYDAKEHGYNWSWFTTEMLLKQCWAQKKRTSLEESGRKGKTKQRKQTYVSILTSRTFKSACC